jgi:hypothetical protein
MDLPQYLGQKTESGEELTESKEIKDEK